MESAIPMHFRPTIIIFADEGAALGAAVARDRNGTTVKSTYDHFCDLCAGLDPALWPGIGLLRAYDGDTAEVLPLATTLAGVGTGGGIGYLPPEAPQGRGDLAALFRFALASVQHEGVYQDIAYADHEAPSPLAQIFIVGSAAADLPSRVAALVNQSIEFYQFKPTVSFVLVNVPYYHSDPANLTRPHPDWVADLVPHNGELPPVNFCYMFEEVTDRGTFLDPNTVHYIVAEALFGFVGTASLNAEIFRHTQETHSRVPNPDARIGSVAPAMIRFPRTAATDYCAARLGADVLREWASEIHVRELPQTEAQDLRLHAQQSADGMTELLRDRVRRPGTERQGGEHLWPDLTTLKAAPPVIGRTTERPTTSEAQTNLQQDANAIGHLEEATAELFSFLDYGTVMRDVHPNESWAQATWHGYSLAGGWFGDWQRVADDAWERIGTRLRYETGAEIDQLWLHDRDGFNVARTYVGHLDDALTGLSNTFMGWRMAHSDAYQAELRRLRPLAESPRWMYEEDPLAPDELRQAAPSAIEMDAEGGPGGASIPLIESEPGGPDVTALTGMERHVINGLNARAEWMDRHIPTWGTLVGIIIMGTAVLSLLGLDLIPMAWATQPRSVAGLIIGVAAALVGCSFAWQRYTVARRDAAQHDVLDAYRTFLEYRAQIREDQLRIAAVLGPVQSDVRAMSGRMGGMPAFMQRLREESFSSAQRIEQELFSGPAALRDVFIGDGQVIGPSYRTLYPTRQDVTNDPNRYTLEKFFTTVNARRMANRDPAKNWHRSFAEINQRLREELAYQRRAVVLLPSDELAQVIRPFLRDIVNAYLTSDLADIGRALQHSGDLGTQLFRTAAHKAVLPYRTPNMISPHLYFAGRAEHSRVINQHEIPTDATEIRTDSREWFYVGRFFQGNGGSLWGVEPAQVGTRVLDSLPIPRAVPPLSESSLEPAPVSVTSNGHYQGNGLYQGGKWEE